MKDFLKALRLFIIYLFNFLFVINIFIFFLNSISSKKIIFAKQKQKKNIKFVDDVRHSLSEKKKSNKKKINHFILIAVATDDATTFITTVSNTVAHRLAATLAKRFAAFADTVGKRFETFFTAALATLIAAIPARRAAVVHLLFATSKTPSDHQRDRIRSSENGSKDEHTKSVLLARLQTTDRIRQLERVVRRRKRIANRRLNQKRDLRSDAEEVNDARDDGADSVSPSTEQQPDGD
jgi:hypothetical protein